jgi:hypothetical protein
MPLKITLRINGGPPIPVRNLRKALKISQAFSMAARYEVEDIFNDVMNRGGQLVSDRRRSSKGSKETERLLNAYDAAIEKSEFSFSSNSIVARMFDKSLMDGATPLSRSAKSRRLTTGLGYNRSSEKGWWRMHEYGSGGRQGSNQEYGFLSFEIAKQIIDPSNPKSAKFLESLKGRDGEGIMVNRASPLYERFNLKPHPGIVPMRIMQRMVGFGSSRMDGIKQRIRRTMIGAITS